MNYFELKANVKNWMHRDDIDSVMDVFIDLFEARANRMLRTPEMEGRAVTTPTDEYIELPSDFLELRNIQVNGSVPILLEYAPPQKIDALQLKSGTPKYYTIVGNEFQINPSAAGTEVEISYYKKIPALSETKTTNWLINQHEDYYLLGVIAEAYFYTMDDRLDAANARLAEKEAFINMQGKRKTYGSGPLVISSC